MHGQHTFSTARIKVGAGRVISVYIKGCNQRRFLLHCWPLHRASKAVKHVALKQLDLHFVSASSLKGIKAVMGVMDISMRWITRPEREKSECMPTAA